MIKVGERLPREGGTLELRMLFIIDGCPQNTKKRLNLSTWPLGRLMVIVLMATVY